MRKLYAMGASALVGLAVLVAAVRADEEKVPLDKVPAAVLKAVKEKFPKAELKQAEKEVEDGATIYEIGLVDGTSNVDVSVKEDGTIIEVETEVAAADLPKPVADAFRAKYPKATVKKAEVVAKGDDKTYELHIADGDKARELVLDPSGTILKDEEDDES